MMRLTLLTRNYFTMQLGPITQGSKGCDYPKRFNKDKRKEKLLKLKQHY